MTHQLLGFATVFFFVFVLFTKNKFCLKKFSDFSIECCGKQSAFFFSYTKIFNFLEKLELFLQHKEHYALLFFTWKFTHAPLLSSALNTWHNDIIKSSCYDPKRAKTQKLTRQQFYHREKYNKLKIHKTSHL